MTADPIIIRIEMSKVDFERMGKGNEIIFPIGKLVSLPLEVHVSVKKETTKT